MEITHQQADKTMINPWQWQQGLGGAYAIRSNMGAQTLYCSGQAAVDSKGKLVGKGDMRAQINQALDNLEQVLTQGGFALSDVVRMNYYTTDINAFFDNYDAVLTRIQRAGAQFASTLLGVSQLALPQLLIEIEATAVKHYPDARAC